MDGRNIIHLGGISLGVGTFNQQQQRRLLEGNDAVAGKPGTGGSDMIKQCQQ
jgi:hypothetical protein